MRGVISILILVGLLAGAKAGQPATTQVILSDATSFLEAIRSPDAPPVTSKQTARALELIASVAPDEDCNYELVAVRNMQPKDQPGHIIGIVVLNTESSSCEMQLKLAKREGIDISYSFWAVSRSGKSKRPARFIDETGQTEDRRNYDLIKDAE